MSPFPHLLLTEALHFCCPPTEIPWLLLCSYLCILLQMEVMSASTEALCSNTFPPVVSTNSRDEWTSAVFLFRSTPNCCDFWNVYLHTSSSLYVYIIMIGRGTLFTNNAHACVCICLGGWLYHRRKCFEKKVLVIQIYDRVLFTDI